MENVEPKQLLIQMKGSSTSDNKISSLEERMAEKYLKDLEMNPTAAITATNPKKRRKYNIKYKNAIKTRRLSCLRTPARPHPFRSCLRCGMLGMEDP